MKIKVGIIFGGVSKEREVSFAGGRTVYDNLNKDVFEAYPVFVDSFNNFVELNWEFVYKGSIRDFYPPVEFVKENTGEFQIYAESLGDLSPEKQEELIAKIGRKISVEELKNKVDFAFLCLHGPFGEDGKIQGLFDFYQIPYSGSGILPSAIGIDKVTQKKLMVNAGFNSPDYFVISRQDWIGGKGAAYFEKAKKEIGFPMVIKAATQGSSIGVTILNQDNQMLFMEAVEKALFTKWIEASDWKALSPEQKINTIKVLADIREGIGMPLVVTYPENYNGTVLYDPATLVNFLNTSATSDGFVLESLDGEGSVLVEGFIEGKEFSCIVLEDESGTPIALPPTEIRKGKELFDYRSKYLPGLSRKITPINLPDQQIEAIRKECQHLFTSLGFGVYARIDGFIKENGEIFLNDPNTTSGMMPSSFFFHQAAEIGLNPSQFLTYIIRASVATRLKEQKVSPKYASLLSRLDNSIDLLKKQESKKIRIGVVLGGYSSERHISVESGRNIYEKLASSTKYAPVPVFLSGNSENHELYIIPINTLLKDNADDIKEKIDHWKVHPIIYSIIEECGSITRKYADVKNLEAPRRISYNDLAQEVDGVFIALHGRPGEDGEVQAELEKRGLPYNGSGIDSSKITINKYVTNEILKQNGLLVAEHMLVNKEEWEKNQTVTLQKIEATVNYPFIAKPVDDGCSSAVKKIKTREELIAFTELIFREGDELLNGPAQLLNIKPKEEFPNKKQYLIEELISKREAIHFLEITGGMLTRYNDKGELVYEVFEASEALSEGDVLSLEEKFLAGQGQNITPARYSRNPQERQRISECVKKDLEQAAKALGIVGYTRIDAFVRIMADGKVETIFVEANSLPGMTPATCIFHQCAINGYKPYEFVDRILDFGFKRFKKDLPVV